jgi:hypothetical protein
MTIFVSGLILAGILVLSAYALAQRSRLPVKFKNFEEKECVAGVVWWARRQIGAADPRQKTIAPLDFYLRYAWLIPITRISIQDLEILAPFIDQFIEGKGPPWILSAEYEDTRPAVLGDFKARMEAEGLWPRRA